MKKIYYSCVALLFGAMFSNVTAQPVTVVNGGFEKGIEEGWGKDKNDGSSASFEEATEGMKEGSKALKVYIDVLGSNPWSIQIKNEKWAVKKDKSYAVSMWMKDVSEGTDNVKVNFTAGMSNGVDTWNEGPRLNDTLISKEWTKYTIYFSPKAEDIAKTDFYAYMSNHFVAKGIVLVDDFTVTETQIKGASMSADGKKLIVEFIQNLNAPKDADKASFAVKVGGVANAVTAIAQSATELNKIELTLTTTVASGAAVTVAYTPGTLATTANVELTAFTSDVANGKSGVSLFTKSASAISVYPNPASEVVCIKGVSGIVSVDILDLSGKLVKTEKCNGTFNVSSLRSGMYFVKAVNASGKSFVSKLSVK